MQNIEDKVHDASAKLSRDRIYNSMFTPCRSRDLLKLEKAMDSVEVAKKRKSTREKKKKKTNATLIGEDSE